MAKIIELKILPEYFEAVKSGKKPFELRKNDRDYCVGDILILREFDGSKKTGRSVTVGITYILQNCGFGLADGYAILGIKPLRGGKKPC
ncbi:MAG: DUF3850 domain-containing protein [Clostridia bacterium]|jgi:hypothetical protein|nr:DUF3850 domain-containing protein [Clostridia bacterium]